MGLTEAPAPSDEEQKAEYEAWLASLTPAEMEEMLGSWCCHCQSQSCIYPHP